MTGWSSERFLAVAQRSQTLHGNKHMLPVAVVIAELDLTVVKAPELGIALGGNLAPNRVLEGLVRLAAMGVMEELPYPGRPNPRIFERRDSAYWTFVEPFAAEETSKPTSTRAPRDGDG